MDETLPTYEAATARNPWMLIASYLRTKDLLALCHVSKKLAENALICLWGEPSLHFGRDEADIFNALVAFMSIVKLARESTRARTHTLNLKAVQPALSASLESDWLFGLLTWLPNLKAVLMDDMPFFDNVSLHYVRGGSARPSLREAALDYGLQMLTAYNCSNAIPGSLRPVFHCFPSLSYLDLSSTRAARTDSVLASIGSVANTPNLRVLKLRDIGLRDQEMEILARALSNRIWSLDVRGNELTDGSCEVLLDHCFEPPDYAPRIDRPPAYTSEAQGNAASRIAHKFPPLRFFLDDSNSYLISEDYEHSVSRRIARAPLVGYVNDGINRGLTHLYISNNRYSWEGVTRFMMSGKLIKLDCGTVEGLFTEALDSVDSECLRTRGAQKLLPIYTEHAYNKLRYLRIGHHFVTSPMRVSHGYDSFGNVEKGCIDTIAYLVAGLRCLELTDVPSFDGDGYTVQALEAFLWKCARVEMAVANSSDEENQKIEFRGAHGRTRSLPKSLWLLRHLGLEFSPIAPPKAKDDDSATFMEALRGDFSFFAAERGVSSLSISARSPGAAPNSETSQVGAIPQDVLGALSRFRKARKHAYDIATSEGRGGPGEEGYWSGNVQLYPRRRLEP
ncbi:MAG: hypothetical protein M1827_006085 [Pycnora praestabilis]|nr:MAG: hypothetical protein M1827_006085 [Pycnora praestabilis]